MKTFVVANWKMNPQSLQEAKRLFNSIKKEIRSVKKLKVAVCPPFIYLFILKKLCSLKNVAIGAQDCFWEKEGAYTGEISPFMLKDIGCKYVIIGHSERRRYFGETDNIINKKLKAVFKAGLSPILCIGETEEERKKGYAKNILRRQIKSALKDISISNFQDSRFFIAYEPVWAIGSGQPCSIEESKKNGCYIRKVISEIYSSEVAKKIGILYGGSVNSKNAVDYIKEAKLDGLLVGGASLKVKEFVKIIKSVFKNCV